MGDIAAIGNTISQLYTLEELAEGSTAVHRLHPMVKLLSTLLLIVVVVSVGRYELVGLTPYLFYPFLLMPLSETPYRPVLKRLALALPFALFAGISNIIFDTKLAFLIGNIGVSFGLLSFFAILVKTYLVVMAVLILASTTTMQALSGQMVRLKIPAVIVLLITMTYRYISVLLHEASSMAIAYSLRSPKGRGIKMKDMGSFVGQLLLRTMDRASRVHAAMKCRGFSGAEGYAGDQKVTGQDILYGVLVCGLTLAVRFVDFTGLIGGLFV